MRFSGLLLAHFKCHLCLKKNNSWFANYYFSGSLGRTTYSHPYGIKTKQQFGQCRSFGQTWKREWLALLRSTMILRKPFPYIASHFSESTRNDQLSNSNQHNLMGWVLPPCLVVVPSISAWWHTHEVNPCTFRTWVVEHQTCAWWCCPCWGWWRP